MNTIHNSLVCLDTNEFIFAFRREASRPSCETLLFDKLPLRNLYLLLQIILELQRNFTHHEMRTLLFALRRAKEVTWDYIPAPPNVVRHWQQKGAKKGDAIIVAHLETAEVCYLISENRHFLQEVKGLPFRVLSSTEALQLLQ